MRYKKQRSVIKSFNRTLKLLDVITEKEVQHFIENPVTIDDDALELLDPIVSVNFERVIILQGKALVQGTINKNIIYKDATADDVEHFEEGPINFGIDIDLPGLTPTFTTGKFNRAVLNNNVITLENNQGTNGGFDVQIYLTNLFTFQRIIETRTSLQETDIDQKIVLDFIIKVSKYIQQDIEFPAPQAVFECRNVKPCNVFIRPVHHDDGSCY